MADISKPSTEEAANLFDQITFADNAFTSEPPVSEFDSEQCPGNQKVKEVKVFKNPQSNTNAKIDGFSILLDHLRSEAIQDNNRNKPRQGSLRYAA